MTNIFLLFVVIMMLTTMMPSVSSYSPLLMQVKASPFPKENAAPLLGGSMMTKAPKQGLSTLPPTTSISPTRTPTFHPTIQIPTQHPTITTQQPTTPTFIPTPSPTIVNSHTSYHGGPILFSPQVYIIFYGTWTTAMQDRILSFINNLGNTSYFNIGTTYYDMTGNHLTNNITLGGWIIDNYSNGPNLTRSGLGTVVDLAQATHLLPNDPKGIYAVLTSGDVLMAGLCTQFCGFHANYGSDSAALVFAGLATACPSGCAPPQYFGNSVNGQLTDGLINVLIHETFEAMTDPRDNAWNPEIADPCEWNFGPILTTSAGLTYNVVLQNHFLVYVQGIIVNINGGYCTTHYP